MNVQDRVAALVEGPLEEMGYELVRVQLSGGGRAVLQIMAERTDGKAMTVDDCVEISQSISVLLDAEDPIAGAYTLEVSSPGIDRPLTKPRDFERFAGFEARIETREAIGDRRRFRGRIMGLKDGFVAVETDQGTVEVPVAGIAKAKLVLSDELIAAHQDGRGA